MEMQANISLHFYLITMKAIIKIVTADKEFTEDQKTIMRRVVMVLIEHNLSACVVLKKKIKESEILNLKVV